MVGKDLNIEKINIKSLIPADYNPRKISEKDYKNLKQSIDEFGIVSPIIINLSDNTIISGHQRFDVLYYENNVSELYLIKLGDVGWVFTETDLKIKDKNYEKTLNLALNRIHGEFDEERLSEVLIELEELKLDHLTGFDLELNEIDYTFIKRLDDGFDEENIIDEDISDEDIFDDDFDEVIYESQEEDLFEETLEEDELEKTIKKDEKNNDRIRRGFIKYGDIYKINDSYLMFGNSNNEQDRSKLLNINNQPNIKIPDGLEKIKSVKKEINYYMSDDAELIENILIENKKLCKKIK